MTTAVQSTPEKAGEFFAWKLDFTVDPLELNRQVANSEDITIIAKFFSLEELIDRESSHDEKISRLVAAIKTLPSPAKMTAVRRSYNEATIWKMALQWEMPVLCNSSEACKLQND